MNGFSLSPKPCATKRDLAFSAGVFGCLMAFTKRAPRMLAPAGTSLLCTFFHALRRFRPSASAHLAASISGVNARGSPGSSTSVMSVVLAASCSFAEPPAPRRAAPPTRRPMSATNASAAVIPLLALRALVDAAPAGSATVPSFGRSALMESKAAVSLGCAVVLGLPCASVAPGELATVSSPATAAGVIGGLYTFTLSMENSLRRSLMLSHSSLPSLPSTTYGPSHALGISR
ncbi:hypothetical protein BU14_0166s0045 [Porphyra umbilicalis]|uniref:Uncharacterized protein n=1 Tax=Porphyra umbilicalis TaxID=2786 RepID=A0A1X6P8D0_PORUM|nr:hypothetical protein BU14_0166s0045 [Porphyra umbilicalis]|eukprot:OSX77005.1 hypothetical protein BU14_0166s0045 [Porphyra umbilicalis]